MRIFLLLSLVATLGACDRFSDSFGAGPARATKGPLMEGVVNPAGLKIPASAVSAQPSSGFWNCGALPMGTAQPEHAVRCTLHQTEPAPRTRTVHTDR